MSLLLFHSYGEDEAAASLNFNGDGREHASSMNDFAPHCGRELARQSDDTSTFPQNAGRLRESLQAIRKLKLQRLLLIFDARHPQSRLDGHWQSI